VIWLVLQPRVRPGPVRPATYVPPDPEETRRGVALAALREIEFDRATGKLSDDDYGALKSRYTALAVQAMRQERAAQPDDASLEAMIAARRHGGAAGTCPSCGPRPESDAAFCSSCGKRLPTGRFCAVCSAPLPQDAGFCERCGAAASEGQRSTVNSRS
jgi:predicted nucleic acid-binding Zn ribbon protein